MSLALLKMPVLEIDRVNSMLSYAAQLARDNDLSGSLLVMSQAVAILNSYVCYHDASFPERVCDRCGETYTGPAVYCSRPCAEGDA